MGLENQHVFNQNASRFVADRPIAYAIQAGALRENPDSGPDGIGVQEGGAYTLEARAEVQAVAFAHQGGGTQTTLGYDPDSDTAMTLQSHQTPAVAFALRGRDGGAMPEVEGDGSRVGALRAASGGSSRDYVATSEAVAFDTTQITSKANYSNPQPGDPCHPLAAGAHVPSIAWSIMPQNSGKDYKARAVDVAQPVMAGGPVGGNQGGDYIQQAWQVRRLTPTECERLQSFPDGFTDITYRGKPAADGPRYKALGNSWAKNNGAWIIGRIAERLAA